MLIKKYTKKFSGPSSISGINITPLNTDILNTKTADFQDFVNNFENTTKTELKKPVQNRSPISEQALKFEEAFGKASVNIQKPEIKND